MTSFAQVLVSLGIPPVPNPIDCYQGNQFLLWTGHYTDSIEPSPVSVGVLVPVSDQRLKRVCLLGNNSKVDLLADLHGRSFRRMCSSMKEV